MVRTFVFRRSIGERLLFSALTLISLCLLPVFALAEPPSTGDPLPSWNEGAARPARLDFPLRPQPIKTGVVISIEND